MLSHTATRWTQEWKAEGRMEGRMEGLIAGELAGEAKLLHGLLGWKFNPLPDWVETRLAAATEEQLVRWARQVLTANSLEAVFVEPN